MPILGTGELLFRTLLSFCVLLVLTRFLGKKQISQLTFFNYVTGITLGSTTAEVIVNNQITVTGGIVSLLVWAVLTVLIEYISLKSPIIRVALDGEPTIVIKKGKILEKALTSCRLNMDDLSMMLREKDVFSVRDVEYAILEPHGQLSILKKSEQESVSRKDMGIPAPPILYMPAELIVDGKVIQKNMKELNLSMAWLNKQVKKAGAHSFEDVFYAEIQTDGTVHVDKRNDLLR